MRRATTALVILGLAVGLAVVWAIVEIAQHGPEIAWKNAWNLVYPPPPEPIRLEPGGGYSGRLIRVVDGDTVVVRYHDFALHVRLLSINTAESVAPEVERNTAFGEKTTAWAKAYLSGAAVRIEFQRAEDGWRISTDKFGRALADLWIDRGPPGPDDQDELYTETVIKQGWSAYETHFGLSRHHHRRLAAAESEAKRERRGIWR